jgi:hypothetical protein
MTEEKKNPAVNLAQLEEAFSANLAEFERGKTYSLITLMDTLKFRHGAPRLRKGRPTKENISDEEIAEAET